MLQFFLFAWVDEDEGKAFFTSASGASTAVSIVVNLFGKLVVDDEGEAFDVDAACCNVSCNEELRTFFFEGSHDFITFKLGEIALKDAYGVFACGQLFGEDVCAVAGASEDEAAFVALAI